MQRVQLTRVGRRPARAADVLLNPGQLEPFSELSNAAPHGGKPWHLPAQLLQHQHPRTLLQVVAPPAACNSQPSQVAFKVGRLHKLAHWLCSNAARLRQVQLSRQGAAGAAVVSAGWWHGLLVIGPALLTPWRVRLEACRAQGGPALVWRSTAPHTPTKTPHSQSIVPGRNLTQPQAVQHMCCARASCC